MAKPVSNHGLKLLAVVIAVFLWVVAQSAISSHIERPFDVPVVLKGVPEDLVSTDRNTDEINILVVGSRAAVRKIDVDKMEYVLDVSKVKAGEASFEIDLSQLEMPRGTRIVGRSPSRVLTRFEKRIQKFVSVRVERTGTPPEGVSISKIDAIPRQIEITGPRREVKRVGEVPTETIDVSSINETTEKEVRVLLGGEYLQMLNEGPVMVKIWVEEQEVSAD